MVGGLSSNVSYQYDDANRLTSVNAVNYLWDNNGNASTRSARRLLNDGVNTYTEVCPDCGCLAPRVEGLKVEGLRVGA